MRLPGAHVDGFRMRPFTRAAHGFSSVAEKHCFPGKCVTPHVSKAFVFKLDLRALERRFLLQKGEMRRRYLGKRSECTVAMLIASLFETGTPDQAKEGQRGFRLFPK